MRASKILITTAILLILTNPTLTVFADDFAPADTSTGAINATGGLTSTGASVDLNTNSNFTTNINTGTSTGTVSIGGNSNSVAVDSNTWDISTAGIVSGLTGITSTGTINFSGAGSYRMREVANHAVAACATVNELVLNTTNNQIYKCTVIGAPGTWVSTGGAGTTPDFEAVYIQDADKIITTTNGAFTIAAGSGAVAVNSTNAAGITLNGSVNGAVNIATGTSTGAVSVGGGANTVAVNSSDWDISTTGAMTGIGAITMDGLLTGTAGATLSGAAINLNASSNFATNIGTGTTTGAVSIGGGADTVAINSTSWDISTAGVVTGLTGITSANGAISLNDNSAANTTSIGGGTTTGAITVGGGANTVAINSTSWDISTAGIASGLTGLTTTGTVSLGNNTGTVAVDSSDWDISATGAMTGIGAITMDGLLTGTAGATLSGAAINLNASSNFATNIGTGTSTGAITIGGNANTVGIDSSVWDITTAGVASGLTGITSTGIMDFSGASRFAMDSGAATPGTCTEGDLFYNTTDNFTYTCTATNTFNTLQPDTATFTDTTPGNLADNDTTEIFNDATRPNITTDSTSSTVLVSFMLRGTSTDADTETNAFRVIRETDGTNPACGTDPQVGQVITGYTTDNPVVWTASGTFLDTPIFAGNIRYTVCSSALSATSNDLDTTENVVNVVLTELGN